jgi:hypothetical protein
MKKIVIFCLILNTILLTNLGYYIFKDEPELKAYYQSQQAKDLEMKSYTTKEPKFTKTKGLQITHTDGTPIPFYIGKFECCGVMGMVKDKAVYIGYYNEVDGKPLGATTTQKIPEIQMETIIHELSHISTLHNFATSSPNDRFIQEVQAYDIQFLYAQIRSYEEDGHFKIMK